ncbi:MAG: hypothetical protein KDC11_03900, partial [Chitinophagaceae bacterium]|nr:hypothetical protein [Chitinophagaceae bacterium]
SHLIFLADINIITILEEGRTPNKFTKGLLIGIGAVIALALILLPVVGLYKAELIPYIKDPFAIANLQADVNWSYSESAWGIIYLIGIITAVVFAANKFKKALIVLFCVQIVMIQVTVAHFTPKIEAFSQRAAIEFYEQFQGKDVYVHVLGYKSYAQLFYTRKMPVTNANSYKEDWLLNGDVDKPTYFVCKIMIADKYRALPQLEEIGSKNGFVFFKRK